MRIYLVLILIHLICGIAAIAQSTTPSPSPSPTISSNANADDDVVKITTNIIQMDFTAVDKKGRPVTDLQPSEVEVYENGKLQKTGHLNFISVASRSNKTDDAAPADPSIPKPPQKLAPENVRRTIALVVDDLNLSFTSIYWTKQALKKFVSEQMADGDLVAIVRSSAGMGSLQQFTSDKRSLYAAIKKIGPSINSRIGSFEPLGELPNEMPDIGEESPDDMTGIDDNFRSDYFATGTLGALRYIIGGLTQLPGRKSIILYSEGMRTVRTNSSGIQEPTDLLPLIQRLIGDANKNSVVIYAIDPRGLETIGLNAEDNTAGRTADQVATALDDRRDQLFDTQSSLKIIAESTGGRAIINDNDIAKATARIIDDQSYYLVAYEPDDSTFDSQKVKFNKIEIKVKRPGVTIRTRSGFYNKPDTPVDRLADNKVKTPAQVLSAAINSPFATQDIDLSMNAVFLNSVEAKGSFVRSILYIDGSHLSAKTSPDGNRIVTLDILALSYGEGGQVSESLGKTYTLTLKPEAYDRIVKSGFVYDFVFPVKKPGAYQYRVALRDANSGRIGSASQFIEVPDIKKGRLTLSSIIIDGMTRSDYDKQTAGGGANIHQVLRDTALRQINSQSVLTYGYEIYNARSNGASSQVTTKTRLIKDGKVVFNGKEAAANVIDRSDPGRLKVSGALVLGAVLTPGDYILQVIATDPLAGAKRRTTTQYITFEIVDPQKK